MYKKYLVIPIIVFVLTSGGKAECSKKLVKDLDKMFKPLNLNNVVKKVTNRFSKTLAPSFKVANDPKSTNKLDFLRKRTFATQIMNGSQSPKIHIKNQMGTSNTLFSATSPASVPSSNPHVAQVHCGSVGVTSLDMSSEKKVIRGTQIIKNRKLFTRSYTNVPIYIQHQTIMTVAKQNNILRKFSTFNTEKHKTLGQEMHQLKKKHKVSEYEFGLFDEFRIREDKDCDKIKKITKHIKALSKIEDEIINKGINKGLERFFSKMDPARPISEIKKLNLKNLHTLMRETCSPFLAENNFFRASQAMEEYTVEGPQLDAIELRYNRNYRDILDSKYRISLMEWEKILDTPIEALQRNSDEINALVLQLILIDQKRDLYGYVYVKVVNSMVKNPEWFARSHTTLTEDFEQREEEDPQSSSPAVGITQKANPEELDEGDEALFMDGKIDHLLPILLEPREAFSCKLNNSIDSNYFAEDYSFFKNKEKAFENFSELEKEVKGENMFFTAGVLESPFHEDEKHVKTHCLGILREIGLSQPSKRLGNFISLLSELERFPHKWYDYDFRRKLKASEESFNNIFRYQALFKITADKENQELRKNILLISAKVDTFLFKLNNLIRKILNNEDKTFCKVEEEDDPQGSSPAKGSIQADLEKLDEREEVVGIQIHKLPKEMREAADKEVAELAERLTDDEFIDHMVKNCCKLLRDKVYQNKFDSVAANLEAFLKLLRTFNDEKVRKYFQRNRFFREMFNSSSMAVERSWVEDLVASSLQLSPNDLIKLDMVEEKINHLMLKIVPRKIERVQTQNNAPKKEAAPKFQYLCEQLFQEKTDWGIKDLKFDPDQADQFNVYIEKLWAIEEKVIEINDHVEPFFGDLYDNPIKKFENLTLKDLAPHILKNCCPILKELGYPKTSEAYKDFINETYNLSGFSLRNDRNYRDCVASSYDGLMQAWGEEILKSSPIAEDKLLLLVLVNQKMAVHRRVYARTIHELIN